MKKDNGNNSFKAIDNDIGISKDRVIDIVLAVVCIIIVLLLSYAAKYTTFNTDDFSFKLMVRDIHQSNENIVIATIKKIHTFYMTWQGTWFSNLVMFTLFGFSLRILHLVVAGTVLLLLLFIFLSIREVIIIFGFQHYNRMSMITFLLVIFTGMNIVTPRDNFYWIDGCMVYTIPLLFGLVGTSVYLYGLRIKSRSRMILGSLCCVLACGGSLIMGALFNTIFLSVIIINYVLNKKVVKVQAISFGIVFLGAIINVIAPGNYIRQGIESSDRASLFTILFYSMEFTAQTFWNYLKSSYLPAICLILIFVLAHKSVNKIDVRINPICFFVGIIFMVFIMYFPYALGYNTDLYVVERVAWVIYLMASIGTIFASIYTGIWLRHHFGSEFSSKEIPSKALAIISLLLINIAIVGSGTMQIPTFISELVSGKYKAIYTDSREIEGLIECCEDDDVTIWHHLDHSNIMRGICLMDYPEYMGNSMIANYYNKNSVILIETDN
ncbi:DUF6056 family protein [Butyrivibrio fibrisolvens]|uniref:Glucosyl transferase GtrII n=1 Tax=Butyrivibrio fibrisolvens TaxID=831 RepID=A0A317FWY5_BUTFI|nr:DUF6056 family protein [Butyrivibrio fibrisolvens]PWT26195.1 hypothetical protein CPT75_03200 [Butyrivibrio fibrisolvens]